MMETWLKPNRRILAVVLAVPLVLAGFGVGLLQRTGPVRFWFGVALLALAILLLLRVIFQMVRCRLGYQKGQLWVGLGPRKPIPVPIDAVECFFLGSTETLLSGRWGMRSRAIAIVVRLAERAVDYHQRTVMSKLGSWNEGYITIRGSWCEPISPALVSQLNKRLSEVQRAIAGHADSDASDRQLSSDTEREKEC